MEKRLPLALFLSFLVLFGWQLLFPPKPAQEPTPGAAAPAAGEAAPEPGAAGEDTGAVSPPDEGPAAPSPSLVAEREETLVVTFGASGAPGYYEASFSNRGARLLRLKLGDFVTGVGMDASQRADHDNWMTLIEPIDSDFGPGGSLLLGTSASSAALFPGDLGDVLWRMEELTGEEGPGVRFRYGPGTGVTITKEIKAVPGSWRLAMTVTLTNESAGAQRELSLRLTPAIAMVPEFADRFYPEPRSVAVGGEADDLDVEWEAAPSVKQPGTLDVPAPIVYAGDHNKYFAFLVHGADAGARRSLSGVRYQPIRELLPGEEPGRKLIATQISLRLELPPEGQSATWRYEVYAGPKDRDTMLADDPTHGALLDEDLSSWFDTIAAIGHGLLVILGFFHGLTGNWGVAIILLTICVRGALFPLNRRTQTAMARYQKKMKRVQPKLEEIKKKYANDLKQQREAQARIMQEEGAFPPLGGCLPVFFQFPVFIGLFSALRTSFDLRQAPFVGYIKDLSKPDQLLRLDLDLPLLITTIHVEYLNLLPLVMIGLMIWQQRGMPKPTDEQAQRMQRMMMVMPFMFAFFLYNYAAGLSLYVITSSALGIIEQKVIKKVWPIDDSEPEKKRKKSGCGPFSGALQNLAEKQKEQMRRMEEMKRREAQRGGTKKKKRKR